MKCLIKSFLFFALSGFLLCFHVQVQAQTPELDSLFSTALNRLENSANRIDSLQSELSESRSYISSLETLSSGQRQTLLRQQETLERQSNSLESINREQIATSRQLIVYQARLKAAIKWVVILAVILLLRFLSMIAGYVIYAKGIKLPRWLDILL